MTNNRPMTVRMLFSIILKVLGVFFIKHIIDLIPQFISITSLYTDRELGDTRLFLYVSLFLILAAYVLAVYMLIFQTNGIIDRLKLDKGFDSETIQLNAHRSTILRIAVIVIGGLVLVDEIPNFCSNIYYYFEQRKLTHGQARISLVGILVPGLKILIGFLLIGESRRIVNLIEYKRRA